MIKYLTSDFKNYEKVNGEKVTKLIDNKMDLLTH